LLLLLLRRVCFILEPLLHFIFARDQFRIILERTLQ